MTTPTPTLDLVATLTVAIAAPIEVGEVEGGFLRVIPITGGTVDGPRISGTVLGLGADWNLRIRDGREHASARYLLKTDDGVVLSVENDGYLLFEDGDVRSVTRPRVQAPEGPYAWLNDAVLAGTLDVVHEDGQVHGVRLAFWQTILR